MLDLLFPALAALVFQGRIYSALRWVVFFQKNKITYSSKIGKCELNMTFFMAWVIFLFLFLFTFLVELVSDLEKSNKKKNIPFPYK